MSLIALHHNRPLRIAGATRIECVAGTVWLTRTGGTGDIFLRAGDICTLERPEDALVEALGQAQIRLHRMPLPWRAPIARAAAVLSSLHERLRTLRIVRWRTPLAG